MHDQLTDADAFADALHAWGLKPDLLAGHRLIPDDARRETVALQAIIGDHALPDAARARAVVGRRRLRAALRAFEAAITTGVDLQDPAAWGSWMTSMTACTDAIESALEHELPQTLTAVRHAHQRHVHAAGRVRRRVQQHRGGRARRPGGARRSSSRAAGGGSGGDPDEPEPGEAGQHEVDHRHVAVAA